MWPSVSGRKTVGTLEAHTNGLRFVSNKGEKVEIIYANIAHGVFQPCDREHVVLIHFHLKHAIMIGKKKYRDVQFFTEVVEASQVRHGHGRLPAVLTRPHPGSPHVTSRCVSSVTALRRITAHHCSSLLFTRCHLIPAALSFPLPSLQAIDGRGRADFDADELGDEERERRIRQVRHERST